MKKWFKRNKVLLIIFAILTVISLITVAIQISYIIQPHFIEDLNYYMETKEIKQSLIKHVIMTVVNIIILGAWTINLTVIIWLVFFPTKKTAKESFQLDSIKYLYNLPEQIKKELKQK